MTFLSPKIYKNISIKISGFILILMLFSAEIQAENNSVDNRKSSIFFLLRGDYGVILQTNDFVRGKNFEERTIDCFSAISFGVGNQTSGKRDWEHLYAFPSYGITFYSFFPDYTKELGKPFALYGFFDAPFHRWGKSALMYKIEFGVTFNWMKYDYYSNPNNIAVGTKNTVYIGLGLAYNYWLSKHIEISAGFNLTHFSNGAYKKPNKGLNMASPSLTLNYHLKPKPDFIQKTNIPAYDWNNEVYITLGAGIKTEELKDARLHDSYPNFHYLASTLSTAYLIQYSHKCKSGLGTSLLYDEFLGSGIRVDETGKASKELGKRSDRFMLNVFLAHELCIDRMSIFLNFGCYAWQAIPDKPRTNQRVGLKYHLKNNIFASVSIYAHRFSKADFIEWNLGYRFKWRKKVF